jgi:hypothetical protein
MPVKPPEIKRDTNPIENIEGACNAEYFLSISVVIQLNTFTEDGIAISKVNKVNTLSLRKDSFLTKTCGAPKQ